MAKQIYELEDHVVKNIRVFVLHARPNGMEEAEQFVYAGKEILEALQLPESALKDAAIEPDAQDSVSTFGSADKDTPPTSKE